MAAALTRTVHHFFPELPRWMQRLVDGRDSRYVTYEPAHLLWLGLLIFCLKLGARRQVRYELDTPGAAKNLSRLCGFHHETVADPDTLHYYLILLGEGQLECLRDLMNQRLIRMKALDSRRLRGYLLVAVDGTGLLAFGNKPHCKLCLHKKSGDTTLYYHPVLEAKLITCDGLALSFATEFIQNPEPNPSKQDCEIKAFIRLAEQIKRQYPQLKLCFLFDALYANGTVFEICRKNGWRFIVTFKRGSLPSLWHEYQTAKHLQAENRARQVFDPECRSSAISQSFAWANNLVHIDEQKHRHTLNAFECIEEKNGTCTTFVWLTNTSLTGARQVMELANGGGRCRWKIENEGFNLQKHGGYALEHAYSTHEQAWKKFYLLVQIAHTLMQLLEHGNLLGEIKKTFGSLRTLARRLGESLRHELIEAWVLDPTSCRQMQIRLNSS